MLGQAHLRGATAEIASFVRDFAGTRASYGLLAAVHAWIEIPVLLLTLAPATRPVSVVADPAR